MRRTLAFVKSDLEQLYHSQDMSLAELGSHYQCNTESVRIALIRFGIPRKPAKNRPGRPQPNKARRGAANGFWKTGRTIDKSGYVLVHRPDHPDSNQHGYIREHRLVAEQALGRRLQPEEVVDHVNGETSDNRPENLVVYPNNSEHLKATLRGRVPNWSPAGYENMLRAAREKASRTAASRARLEAYALLHSVSVSQIRGRLTAYELRLLSKELARGRFELHEKLKP